ncbi:MAG: hypothetical protein ACRYGL_15805 [Janthinobacterium lividum]
MTPNPPGISSLPRCWRGVRRTMRRLIALVPLLLCGFFANSNAAQLDWAGITWEVRTGHGPPCATSIWNEHGAWVDTRGWLHLALRKLPSGSFACVELRSAKRFGFGRYTFDVTGPIGEIDKNVVLGLFLYPTQDVGLDGTNEIDIEVARWGHPAGPQVNYTVWYRSRKGSRSSRVPVADNTDHATFTLEWQDGLVDWTSSLHPGKHFGFRDDVADQPQTLSLNLWLFRQVAPEDRKDVEFVIKSLTFE